MTKRRLRNSSGYAISPSDEEYEEFDRVWRLNAIAKNEHMHRLGFSHSPDFSVQDAQNAIDSRMEHMLDGVQQVWFDAIDGEHTDVIIDDSTGMPINKDNL